MGLSINTLRHVKHGSRRWLWKTLYRSCEYIVLQRLNGNIASGLFQGMQFTRSDICSTPMPKLLGTYEKEIQNILNRWTNIKFRRLINVGGAEGLYAVGIVKRLNVDHAIVYEMLEEAQVMICHVSGKNCVSSNVTIRPKCKESDLYEVCDERAHDLVLIDVEGAEIELLTPRVIEKLRNSTVVVEAHDFKITDCTDFVKDMFSNTHVTEVISSKPRTVVDFPLRYPLPKAIKLAMMDERRPQIMNWIIATPRKTSVGGF